MATNSAWGYKHITVTDRAVGISEWWHETVSLADPGKPNLMVAGKETDIDWRVMKNGASLPVLRWEIVKDGSATVLDGSHSVTWTPPAYTAGADAVGSTNYTIPSSDVIYLATTGSDSNAGTTTSAPKATLASALATVPIGGTIVIRGGVYHQGDIDTTKSCTIQNYPGEAVWFDGSTPFNPTWSGSGPWTAPYDITYDRLMGKTSGVLATWSGKSERFVVDQVWIDGTKMKPAPDNTASPGEGKFSVNQAAHTITVGSSPVGKSVRVVDLKYLLTANVPLTVRGIGVRRYAQAMIEWRNAALWLPAGSTVEQLTVQDCSVAALNMSGADVTIRRCTMQDIGQTGVYSAGNGMIFEQNIIRRCNRNGYDPEPTTAGIKVGPTWHGCTIRHNYVEDVPGSTAIWLDTSISQAKIYGNTVIGTSALGTGYRMKNGIEIEGCDGMLFEGVQYKNYVVGNRISDCRQAGLLIFDSGHIRIWNNDISAAVALYLWQDYRENKGLKPATEGTASQFPWHTTDIDIVNNKFTPESVYLTQLRAQSNSDAAFKIAGGNMISRLASNWFQPAGSGFMAYLSSADGNSWSSRQTLSALESTANTFGGPLAPKMSDNHQGVSAPSNSGMAIQSDVAVACGIPTGHTPITGAIWPDLILAE